MSELTLDDTVAAMLSSQTEEVVLRDKSGKELGRFRPTSDQAALHARRNPFTLEDLEEAKRAASKGGGLPLAEIWKQIKAEAGK